MCRFQIKTNINNADVTCDLQSPVAILFRSIHPKATPTWTDKTSRASSQSRTARRAHGLKIQQSSLSQNQVRPGSRLHTKFKMAENHEYSKRQPCSTWLTITNHASRTKKSNESGVFGAHRFPTSPYPLATRIEIRLPKFATAWVHAVSLKYHGATAQWRQVLYCMQHDKHLQEKNNVDTYRSTGGIVVVNVFSFLDNFPKF